MPRPTGDSGSDTGLPRVEQRGDAKLLDCFVQREVTVVVGLERLETRVELEPLDAMVGNQSPGLAHRSSSTVQVDRAEGNQYVGVLACLLCDLLARQRRVSSRR